MQYIESENFYKKKRNMRTLRILIISFIIINTIIIYSFYNGNNIVDWINIIILINILFPCAIIITAHINKKELFFKRFEITDQYMIMPYISGIKIPENRVYYSSITGQYKRTENLPYFILVININELKKFHLNLSKIPRFYNLVPNQEIPLGASYPILVEGMLRQYYLGVSDPSVALVTSEPPYVLQPKSQGKALLLVIDRFEDDATINSRIKSPSYITDIPFIVTR